MATNELADILKDIVTDGVKQDKAILDLCAAMIERIISIEKRENMFMESLQVHMDILKIHTDTNTKIREVVKTIVARIEVLEEHDEELLTSVVMLKELMDKLISVNKEQVH